MNSRQISKSPKKDRENNNHKEAIWQKNIWHYRQDDVKSYKINNKNYLDKENCDKWIYNTMEKDYISADKHLRQQKRV